jgi:phage baseplate assembly protein W
MATPTTYKGFSTIGAERTQQWTRFDVDLVKIDLMNQFQTRIGERVMRPNYGCRIWDYLNEPLTPALREMIINEAVRIVSGDPRVALQGVNLFDFENGIRIEILVDFIGILNGQTFYVEFEARQSGAGL